jgi:uncharacterized lipoprotein YbaY
MFTKRLLSIILTSFLLTGCVKPTNNNKGPSVLNEIEETKSEQYISVIVNSNYKVIDSIANLGSNIGWSSRVLDICEIRENAGNYEVRLKDGLSFTKDTIIFANANDKLVGFMFEGVEDVGGTLNGVIVDIAPEISQIISIPIVSESAPSVNLRSPKIKIILDGETVPQTYTGLSITSRGRISVPKDIGGEVIIESNRREYGRFTLTRFGPGSLVMPDLIPEFNPTAITLSTDEDVTEAFQIPEASFPAVGVQEYEVRDNPTNGTLACTNRDCSYTPNPGFVGVDTFSVRAFLDRSPSEPLVYTMNVLDTPDNPILEDANLVVTDENTPVAFNLANATDPDGDVNLTYTIVSPLGAGDGTLTCSVMPACNYTPVNGFVGEVSFTLKVTDSTGLDSQTKIQRIQVNNVNDAPVLDDPVLVETNQATPVTFNLPSASDADGDAITYFKESDPSNGGISCNLSANPKTCTYSPNISFVGDDSFSIYVEDSNSARSASKTITIRVHDVNEAPTIAAQSVAYSTNEDTTLTGMQLPLGSDPDGDAVRHVVVTNPANGSITCSNSGLCNYTPSLNFNGTDTLQVKVTDESLDSEIRDITITVNPINDAPELSIASGPVTTPENTPVTFTIPMTASDVDNTQGELTWNVSAPVNGSIDCSSAPSCTYTPNNSFIGSESLDIYVSDLEPLSSITRSLTIDITNVNDAPVLEEMAGAVITNEDTLVNFQLPNASDADGDSLTWLAHTQPANGTLSCNASGNCDYTPSLNFNGADTFKAKVNDGSLDSNIVDVSITVNPINDAPELSVASNAINTPEDTPITFTIPMTATDVDNAQGELIWSVSAPANGSIDCSSAPSCTYTPNLNFVGSESLSISISDLEPLSSSVRTLEINVSNSNDAPVLASVSDLSTDEDQSVDFTLSATDADGDAISYLVESQGGNGSVSCVDENCTYTPNLNFNGSDSFQMKANDSTVDSNIITINVTVNPVNDAPTMEVMASTVVTDEDVAVGFQLPNGSDIDGDALAWTIVTQPTNGSVVCSVRDCTYTPDSGFSGSDSLQAVVNDGTINSNIIDVDFTVNNVNSAPTLSAVAPLYTDINTPLDFSLSANDIDGDSLSYIVSFAPSNGVTNCISNNCTYTPSNDFNGSDSFQMKVNDGEVDSNIITINVQVGPPPATAFQVEEEKSRMLLTLNNDKVSYIDELNVYNDVFISPLGLTSNSRLDSLRNLSGGFLADVGPIKTRYGMGHMLNNYLSEMYIVPFIQPVKITDRVASRQTDSESCFFLGDDNDNAYLQCNGSASGSYASLDTCGFNFSEIIATDKFSNMIAKKGSLDSSSGSDVYTYHRYTCDGTQQWAPIPLEIEEPLGFIAPGHVYYEKSPGLYGLISLIDYTEKTEFTNFGDISKKYNIRNRTTEDVFGADNAGAIGNHPSLYGAPHAVMVPMDSGGEDYKFFFRSEDGSTYASGFTYLNTHRNDAISDHVAVKVYSNYGFAIPLNAAGKMTHIGTLHPDFLSIKTDTIHDILVHPHDMMVISTSGNFVMIRTGVGSSNLFHASNVRKLDVDFDITKAVDFTIIDNTETGGEDVILVTDSDLNRALYADSYASGSINPVIHKRADFTFTADEEVMTEFTLPAAGSDHYIVSQGTQNGTLACVSGVCQYHGNLDFRGSEFFSIVPSLGGEEKLVELAILDTPDAPKLGTVSPLSAPSNGGYSYLDIPIISNQRASDLTVEILVQPANASVQWCSASHEYNKDEGLLRCRVLVPNIAPSGPDTIKVRVTDSKGLSVEIDINFDIY